MSNAVCAAVGVNCRIVLYCTPLIVNVPVWTVPVIESTGVPLGTPPTSCVISIVGVEPVRLMNPLGTPNCHALPLG